MSIEPIKDGLRSSVRIDFYGNVHKRMRGTDVANRYATEVKVLKVLEERGCPYVPKVLEEHPEEFYFVSTNCGRPAPQITKDKADSLFEALEKITACGISMRNRETSLTRTSSGGSASSISNLRKFYRNHIQKNPLRQCLNNPLFAGRVRRSAAHANHGTTIHGSFFLQISKARKC